MEKYQARQALNKAIASGRVRTGPCEVCGLKPTEAHHIDYKRKLTVVWLCKTHHDLITHRKKTLEEIKNDYQKEGRLPRHV